MSRRTYDDDALAEAVSASRSWREVLRRLGLSATSSAAIRSVRQQTQRLDLDCSHFTGQRRWTDAQLSEAVAQTRSWVQTADRLGLSGGSSTTALKGHAARLGIDASHFVRAPLEQTALHTEQLDPTQLPRAGSLLAATWFTLHGHDVSWPLEPCCYDLVVHTADGLLRVQVKTTRLYAEGSWVASIQSGGRNRGPYDPDDIDYFFIVDGDLTCYLIPISVVAGKSRLCLSSYEELRLEPLPLT